jgi:CSLREA domain-containing protein
MRLRTRRGSLDVRLSNGIRIGVLAAVAATIMPSAAMAADFTVTTTADGADKECEDDCTLREAVALAGSNDRVIVPAGDYLLTKGELVLVSDELVGAGARTTSIDGGNASRVLRVCGSGSQVSGVTITGGNGKSDVSSGIGGGVFVQRWSSLSMVESAVKANTASRGGGIAAAGKLDLRRSTVSGNTAMAVWQTSGGGIAVDPSGELVLVNSTVSGNAAVDSIGIPSSRAGGVFSHGALLISHSTIAGNAASKGQLFATAPHSGMHTIKNSILAASAGEACARSGVGAFEATNNVVDDASCRFKDPSNRQNADPALGPLANNGGPTDTHALLPGSAAISAAGACIETDQRDIARPSAEGGSCDAGAYEYRAPTLKLIMAVVNDSGGTLTANQFTTHVRTGGVDVKGSPVPGNPAGTAWTLDEGSTYTVSADPMAGYALTISGDCAVNGTIALAEGQNRICTITADDVAPRHNDASPVRGQAGGQLPPPEAGETVNALPKSGKVRVKLPGTDKFVLLESGRQLPVGTIVDVREGHVTLLAAADRSGATVAAEFWAGLFRLGQTKSAAPTTILTLVAKLSCPKRGEASAAAKRKKKRKLWGDGSGKFRTDGEFSSATVRGTKWFVEDRCDSTLTKVVTGRVAVRDFVKKKTVIVRAGKKYVAKRKR